MIRGYVDKLKIYLPYVGYCPVSAGYGRKKLKYIIFFASRHKDARFLMNNIMFESYRKFLWSGYSKGTLWEIEDYEENLPSEYFFSLERDIINTVTEQGKVSKSKLWEFFLDHKFMYYKSKHFNQKIRELIKNKILDYKPISKAGRPNDKSILFIRKNNNGN